MWDWVDEEETDTVTKRQKKLIHFRVHCIACIASDEGKGWPPPPPHPQKKKKKRREKERERVKITTLESNRHSDLTLSIQIHKKICCPSVTGSPHYLDSASDERCKNLDFAYRHRISTRRSHHSYWGRRYIITLTGTKSPRLFPQKTSSAMPERLPSCGSSSRPVGLHSAHPAVPLYHHPPPNSEEQLTSSLPSLSASCVLKGMVTRSG